MDTSRDALAQRGIQKEESDCIRYGPIYDELHGSSCLSLGHALLSAIHLLNRIPSKSIPTTPYELWHGKKPTLGYLKI